LSFHWPLLGALAANKPVEIATDATENEKRHRYHKEDAVIQTLREARLIGITGERVFAIWASTGDARQEPHNEGGEKKHS
jgi:hypothetical protein